DDLRRRVLRKANQQIGRAEIRGVIAMESRIDQPQRHTGVREATDELAVVRVSRRFRSGRDDRDVMAAPALLDGEIGDDAAGAALEKRRDVEDVHAARPSLRLRDAAPATCCAVSPGRKPSTASMRTASVAESSA